MAVITISREFGSGGDRVAARLCELLGYHSFGKAQIIAAAQETSMSMLNAVDYSEDNHEIQSFLKRLLGQSASPVQTIAWTANPSIATQPRRADVHELAVIGLVKRAVKAAQRADNMVIVGRGGQVLLQDAPGVLHVRLEAPLEFRTRQVMEQLRSEHPEIHSESTLLRQADELIATRDLASADYIRRFFEVDWADRSLYHLILNMSLFNPEQAASLIVFAVKALEPQHAVAE